MSSAWIARVELSYSVGSVEVEGLLPLILPVPVFVESIAYMYYVWAAVMQLVVVAHAWMVR